MSVPGSVKVALKILALVVGVQILPGKENRPLRLSVRTKDSQSLKRGSIPLGANWDEKIVSPVAHLINH